MQLDTPDGVVQLREPDEVTEAGTRGIERAALLMPGDRRRLFAEAAGNKEAAKEIEDQFSAEDHDAAKALTDATILAFVRSWDYQGPLGVLPLTRDGLGEVPRRSFQVLEAEVDRLSKLLHPDFSPSSEEDSPT